MNAVQRDLSDFIGKMQLNGVKDRNEQLIQEEKLILKRLDQMYDNGESEYVEILHLLMIINRIRSNQEAQNYMRECGSLAKLSTILCGQLEENEINLVTECLVVAIAACFRKPWHRVNQTSIGYIIPAIINYFNKVLEWESIPNEINLWRLLNCLIKNNEENQQLFMKNEGLNTVFDTFSAILSQNEGNEIILIKNMQILLNLIFHKDFFRKILDSNFDIIFAVGLLQKNNAKLTHYTFQLLTVLNASKPSKNPQASATMESILSRRKFHKREIREKGKKLEERVLQIYKPEIFSEETPMESLADKDVL